MASDAMEVKQILQQKKIMSTITEFPRSNEPTNLILTRHIGLKETLPGSGQWNMLTEIDDCCWYTDQWIYTLIFWDAKTIGKNALENLNKIQ